jgi:hypothetical protein
VTIVGIGQVELVEIDTFQRPTPRRKREGPASLSVVWHQSNGIR